MKEYFSANYEDICNENLDCNNYEEIKESKCYKKIEECHQKKMDELFLNIDKLNDFNDNNNGKINKNIENQTSSLNENIKFINNNLIKLIKDDLLKIEELEITERKLNNYNEKLSKKINNKRKKIQKSQNNSIDLKNNVNEFEKQNEIYKKQNKFFYSLNIAFFVFILIGIIYINIYYFNSKNHRNKIKKMNKKQLEPLF